MHIGPEGAHEAGSGNNIFGPDEMPGVAAGARHQSGHLFRPGPRSGAYSLYAKCYDFLKFGHMRCDG